jgi:hypothetical protein
MTDIKLTLVVACALVDADKRVLIAQRPPGKTMAGLWEFPGGKIEPGERPIVLTIARAGAKDRSGGKAACTKQIDLLCMSDAPIDFRAPAIKSPSLNQQRVSASTGARAKLSRLAGTR